MFTPITVYYPGPFKMCLDCFQRVIKFYCSLWSSLFSILTPAIAELSWYLAHLILIIAVSGNFPASYFKWQHQGSSINIWMSYIMVCTGISVTSASKTARNGDENCTRKIEMLSAIFHGESLGYRFLLLLAAHFYWLTTIDYPSILLEFKCTKLTPGNKTIFNKYDMPNKDSLISVRYVIRDTLLWPPPHDNGTISIVLDAVAWPLVKLSPF